MTISAAQAIELDALRAHLWDVSSLMEDHGDGFRIPALEDCAQEIADLLEMEMDDPHIDPKASWARMGT